MKPRPPITAHKNVVKANPCWSPASLQLSFGCMKGRDRSQSQPQGRGDGVSETARQRNSSSLTANNPCCCIWGKGFNGRDLIGRR